MRSRVSSRRPIRSSIVVSGSSSANRSGTKPDKAAVANQREPGSGRFDPGLVLSNAEGRLTPCSKKASIVTPSVVILSATASTPNVNNPSWRSARHNSSSGRRGGSCGSGVKRRPVLVLWLDGSQRPPGG